MKHFKDTALFARIRKGITVEFIFVATRNYLNKNKYYSLENCFICDSFEIYENVGGDVFIKTYTKMEHSDTKYSNEIKLEKGTAEQIRLETIL